METFPGPYGLFYKYTTYKLFIWNVLCKLALK